MSLHKRLLLSDVGLKFAGNAGSFSGYASVFGGVDSYDDTILPGAYKSVIDAIASGLTRMPKMFVNHKSWDLPIGKWLNLAEDDKGLMVNGELTPNMPLADTVKAAMQHQTIDGLSIGYALAPTDFEYVQKDGVTIRVIKNISRLEEVSIVTFPADDAARVDLTSVKATLDQINSIKEFEDFLREAGGFSKSLATATASRIKRVLSQGEPETLVLPLDIQRQIAENLKNSRSL